MKIETKFNVGDKVFIIFQGKIEKVNIKSINIYGGVIFYELDFRLEVFGSNNSYKENRLASSKKELIESL